MPGRIGVGVDFADVAQPGGPEQGVGQSVQYHVGVAVAGQAARMGNANAAEQERPTLFQSMCIVSDAHAHAGGLPRRQRLEGDSIREPV